MRNDPSKESILLALIIGGMLALFVSLSTFREMPLSRWLFLNNLLVIVSLILAAFLGYQHRRFDLPYSRTLLSIAAFFVIIAVLYLISYTVTTRYFADQMAWIPFSYHDYNYHGFKSVSDYLNHKDNSRQLLELQVISLLICSVMYFASGSLGYAARAIFNGARSKRVAGGSPS